MTDEWDAESTNIQGRVVGHSLQERGDRRINYLNQFMYFITTEDLLVEPPEQISNVSLSRGFIISNFDMFIISRIISYFIIL